MNDEKSLVRKALPVLGVAIVAVAGTVIALNWDVSTEGMYPTPTPYHEWDRTGEFGFVDPTNPFSFGNLIKDDAQSEMTEAMLCHDYNGKVAEWVEGENIPEDYLEEAKVFMYNYIDKRWGIDGLCYAIYPGVTELKPEELEAIQEYNGLMQEIYEMVIEEFAIEDYDDFFEADYADLLRDAIRLNVPEANTDQGLFEILEHGAFDYIRQKASDELPVLFWNFPDF